jgi:uncharacterized protein YqeY
VSTKRLKADLESASLAKDVQRLTELREFLATINNPGSRRRVDELTEQLKRIEKRLAELAEIT